MTTATAETIEEAPPPGRLRDVPAALFVPALLVGGCAAAATAHGLYEVAMAARVPAGIAFLYPVITDGLALVAYSSTPRLRGAGRRYAWLVMVLAAALSGLAQAVYLGGAVVGTVPALVRFGVGLWPALAAAIAAHLVYLIVAEGGRTGRHHRPAHDAHDAHEAHAHEEEAHAPAPAAAQPAPAPAPAPPAAPAGAPQPDTAPALPRSALVTVPARTGAPHRVTVRAERDSDAGLTSPDAGLASAEAELDAAPASSSADPDGLDGLDEVDAKARAEARELGVPFKMPVPGETAADRAKRRSANRATLSRARRKAGAP